MNQKYIYQLEAFHDYYEAWSCYYTHEVEFTEQEWRQVIIDAFVAGYESLKSKDKAYSVDLLRLMHTSGFREHLLQQGFTPLKPDAAVDIDADAWVQDKATEDGTPRLAKQLMMEVGFTRTLIEELQAKVGVKVVET